MTAISRTKTVGLLCSLLTSLLCPATAQETTPLTLDNAVVEALANDPWLQSNRLQQNATESRSIAADALPDPTLTFAMMNLPVDSFSPGQENMTQAQVGLSQAFPRGDSRLLNRQKLAIQAAMGPHERANRRAIIEREVTLLWLDAYQAQATHRLLLRNQSLFEKMREIAQSMYTSAAGGALQQDIVRAELALMRYDDRITVQAQKMDAALAALGEWLAGYDKDTLRLSGAAIKISTRKLTHTLPTLQANTSVSLPVLANNTEMLVNYLMMHPTVQAIELAYQASQKDVALAKQQYKPQWKVSASYGWRDDTPAGTNRADLASVGLSVDLPLFSRHRQDHNLDASIYASEAVKTRKLLTLKSLMAGFQNQVVQLQHISQRQNLYTDNILEQADMQAETAMTAYTNDNGDFAEVVQAQIDKLEAEITALSIQVEKQKQLARLNYFLVQSEPVRSTRRD